MDINGEQEKNKLKEIVHHFREKYDISEEECYHRIYQYIAPRNSWNKNQYGMKPILNSKQGLYIPTEAREFKKDLDTFFPRDSEYGSVVEKITDKKKEGVKLHQEIIQLKETINEIKIQTEQKIHILENENDLLKRNQEVIKEENKRLEKRIRLMEENNHHDMKKEVAKINNNNENKYHFNDKNKHNNPIHMNHCSNITINMIDKNNNNNNKEDDHSLFYNWFEIKFKKTDHERDFEKVEDVLAQYKSDIHKSISSKKLGQKMFRIGVGVAKRKTFPNGTRPYCYVGIKLKDKKENNLNISSEKM